MDLGQPRLSIVDVDEYGGTSVVKRVVPSRLGPDRCGLSLVRVTAGQARAGCGLQKLGPSPPRRNAQSFTGRPAGCEPKGAPIDF